MADLIRDVQAKPELKRSILHVQFLAGWDQRLHSTAERLSAGIEQYWYVVILCLSIGYFSDTLSRASRKLFWFDEIFTI